MGYALAQFRASAANIASPASLAYNSNNVAGNTLVIVGRIAGVNAISVSDSQGNTWNIPVKVGPSSNNQFFMAYALNCKAGANTVTITSTSGQITIVIAEYSGIGSFGTSNGATNTSSSINSGSISITVNNELVVGGEYGNLTFTPTAGWTTESGGGTAFVPQLLDKLGGVSIGTQAMSGTFTTSAFWLAGIMSFLPAGSPQRTLTGVGI